MPELPEVETIRRVIEPQIQGLTITKVMVNRAEVVAYPEADAFCGRLTGQSVSSVMRRGKFLTVLLEDGQRMILHLRMTGCLLLTPPDFMREKHTHVVLGFDDGRELRFSDTRRFGRFWLLEKGETDTYTGIEKLGIEPFDPALCAEYLITHLGRRKKTVKECLLEQHIIAGIGNIYSDEILFTAGIYPERSSNSLRYEEWERLAGIIPERLSYFIEKNQITPEDYLQTKGKDYRNTPFLQVYGQAGQPCPVCKSILQKMKVGGRSSVYCPACQKKPSKI